MNDIRLNLFSLSNQNMRDSGKIGDATPQCPDPFCENTIHASALTKNIKNLFFHKAFFLPDDLFYSFSKDLYVLLFNSLGLKDIVYFKRTCKALTNQVNQEIGNNFLNTIAQTQLLAENLKKSHQTLLDKMGNNPRTSNYVLRNMISALSMYAQTQNIHKTIEDPDLGCATIRGIFELALYSPDPNGFKQILKTINVDLSSTERKRDRETRLVFKNLVKAMEKIAAFLPSLLDT